MPLKSDRAQASPYWRESAPLSGGRPARSDSNNSPSIVDLLSPQPVSDDKAAWILFAALTNPSIRNSKNPAVRDAVPQKFDEQSGP